MNAKSYVSGNVVLPGITYPSPSVIKKGTTINICGKSITGTFEGYVASPSDLYLRGNNIYGFERNNSTLSIYFESGGIRLPLTSSTNYDSSGILGIKTTKAIDVTKYSYLNIEGYYERGIKDPTAHPSIPDERDIYLNFDVYIGAVNKYLNLTPPKDNSNFNIRMDISNISLTGLITIWLRRQSKLLINGWITCGGKWGGYLYRIWLS